MLFFCLTIASSSGKAIDLHLSENLFSKVWVIWGCTKDWNIIKPYKGVKMNIWMFPFKIKTTLIAFSQIPTTWLSIKLLNPLEASRRFYRGFNNVECNFTNLEKRKKEKQFSDITLILKSMSLHFNDIILHILQTIKSLADEFSVKTAWEPNKCL